MFEKFIGSFKLEDEEYESSRYEYDDEPEYGNHTEQPRYRTTPKYHQKHNESESIIVCKPKKADDAKDIIDKLMEGHSVTINLGDVEVGAKQRIMDMVAGYCYCTKCNIEQVTQDIYLVSENIIETEEMK